MNNTVMQCGYVGKYINVGGQEGSKYVFFSLNQSLGREKHQYLPCAAYDTDNVNAKRATMFSQLIQPGDYIYCEGRLVVKKDKNNNTQTQFIVDNIYKRILPEMTATKTEEKPKPSFNDINQPQGIEITPDDLPF